MENKSYRKYDLRVQWKVFSGREGGTEKKLNEVSYMLGLEPSKFVSLRTEINSAISICVIFIWSCQAKWSTGETRVEILWGVWWLHAKWKSNNGDHRGTKLCPSCLRVDNKVSRRFHRGLEIDCWLEKQAKWWGGGLFTWQSRVTLLLNVLLRMLYANVPTWCQG